MTAPPLLYVGEDLCYRVPIMEHSGLTVVRSECSVEGVERTLVRDKTFSAITFNADSPRVVVAATRRLSTAPLIVFGNPSGNKPDFDLVIPSSTSPEVWLEFLREAVQLTQVLKSTVEEARALRLLSQNLRDLSQDVRCHSEELRTIADCLYKNLLDANGSERK